VKNNKQNFVVADQRGIVIVKPDMKLLKTDIGFLFFWSDIGTIVSVSHLTFFIDNGKIILILVLALREDALTLASKKVTIKYNLRRDSIQIKSVQAHTDTQSMTKLKKK
jgi:hypothetical protein